jgi:hypothetical protein
MSNKSMHFAPCNIILQRLQYNINENKYSRHEENGCKRKLQAGFYINIMPAYNLCRSQQAHMHMLANVPPTLRSFLQQYIILLCNKYRLLLL